MRYGMDPTLRVEARFKNARLYNAIAERSLSLSLDKRVNSLQRVGPIKAWCDLHGINHQAVYDLMNLKMSPVMLKGRIRPICEQLALLLECDIGWLFPADMYTIKWPSIATEIDHRKMVPLIAAGRNVLALPPTQQDDIEVNELRTAIGSALATLTPREARVIQARFGLDDGEEKTAEIVAGEFRVSRERIRQIEAKALRKLRHPSRARPLWQAGSSILTSSMIESEPD